MSQQESESVATQQTERKFRKTARGYVVSDKMDKTVVVEVEDRVKHALYGKVMRRTSRLKAHDENNECGVGDRVLFGKWSGTEVKIGDQKFTLVREEDILGIIA